MRDWAWFCVIIALLLLIYVVGVQCELNREAVEQLQSKIDNLETKLDKESQVDIFVRQLKSSGIDYRSK